MKTTSTYVERLQTFRDSYWDDAMATARQLAAIGHASDRPPLESLEEGSRCISCSFFLSKKISLALLDSPVTQRSFLTAKSLDFHHNGCVRLSTRIPHDADGSLCTSYQYPTKYHKNRSEETLGLTAPEKSHLWKLPIEIRLQVYNYLSPTIPKVSDIVQRVPGSCRLLRKAVPQVTVLASTQLLRTCRAVHDEALGDMYARTKLRFANTKLLYIHLRRIGYRGRRLIRSVEFRCGQREDPLAFALLACCENLTSMTICMAGLTINRPGAPLWLIEGTATLLDISGIERLDFTAIEEPEGASWSLVEGMYEAQVLRKEVMRPRGTPGSIRFVNGIPDL